jgi:hypothetical protein
MTVCRNCSLAIIVDDKKRFRATFGSDRQLEINTYVGPTKYSILFWHRRDQEGSTALAQYILARLFAALNSDSEKTAAPRN